ncbi:hypothetical protein, partial [Acinetobacter baumannii]|uniref:hypothetical protein n=1 Tax=Acinetobacter baumannii TaxID=470 RepID=UPI002340A2B2
SEGEVFSAVNPAWGIKYDKNSGNVSKLYSIFNESGDMIVTNGTIPAKLNSDLTVPSVYFAGTMTTYMHSVGTVSDVNAFGAATAYLVPQLASYGSSTTFALGLLYSKIDHDANSPSGAASPYTAAAWTLSRPDSNNTTLKSWTNFASAWGATGSVGSNVTTGYESAKPLSIYADSAGLKAFNNGVLVTSDITVTQLQTQKNNLGFWFGSSITANGDQASSYFIGHFFENWVLVNTDSEKLTKISERINDKYYVV